MEILYLTIKDDNEKRVFLNGNYSERELKNRLLGRISQEDYEMGGKTLRGRSHRNQGRKRMGAYDMGTTWAYDESLQWRKSHNLSRLSI